MPRNSKEAANSGERGLFRDTAKYASKFSWVKAQNRDEYRKQVAEVAAVVGAVAVVLAADWVWKYVQEERAGNRAAVAAQAAERVVERVQSGQSSRGAPALRALPVTAGSSCDDAVATVLLPRTTARNAASSGMGLSSKFHPYKRQGGQAARCACCVRSTPAGSTGWVKIHVEGEAAFYRSGCNHTAIGQVTATMSEVITACDNLKPALIPLAHRTCAEAAAAALAAGKRLQGQEPASQLQPMPSLCFTPTQAVAQPGPAHAPCPQHLPDQPPSHPSQSQLQGSSQHHPALPALLHLPGLTILTRPATNPVTSPAEEQQPIIHTTEEQDEQTMPPSMPKQQQDWATARAIAAEILQQIQQVPALLRLLRSQPDSSVMLQLSTLQDTEVQLGRLEFALQHIMQPRPFSTSQLAAVPGEQGSGTPAPLQQGAIHFEQQQQQEPSKRRQRGSAAGPRDKQFERMGQEVMEVFGRCGSAEQQAKLLEKVLTSPQLQLAVQQAMEQCARLYEHAQLLLSCCKDPG
ncbi:hypothetical protein QJQ45_001495 [Haematococcus lacustris]|nr:hypothetical protein QJQ45_001495 [Haematococcus lacustris]